MVHRKKVILLTSLGLVILAGTLFVTRTVSHVQTEELTYDCQINPQLEIKALQIDELVLQAEIAAASTDQQQGLSGRNCLDKGRAMLFPYQSPGNYCFWMNDMKFPIDMIWLDKDKKVITIKSDVQPESYPDTFCPENPAQYVVEVNAGVSRDNGWKIGTQFAF